MSKILIVLRHGHAEQTHKDSSLDFERPLTDRGRAEVTESAKQASAFVKEPIQMLASAAKRTRQTAEAFRKALGRGLSTEFKQNLYQANANDWLQEISDTSETLQTLVLVGHNPSVSELCSMLSKANLDMATGSYRAYSTDKRWQEVTVEDWHTIG